MILKNEAHTIARTLSSVKPHVDRWLVLDTGSTDGTPDVVRRAMEGVEGEVHTGPFVDFATTRNRSLELCGTQTEFILWLDADDEISGGEALRKFLASEKRSRAPDREAYYVRVEAGVAFDSARVLRARAAWRFRGVVHEVLSHPETAGPPAHRIPGVLVRHIAGQDAVARSQKRWERDVGLLSRALEEDPSNARTAFYLGQTLRWLARDEEAIVAFRRRIAMGGWAEEIF